MQNDQVHLTKTEARAGVTPHVVRYVLAISLLLVVMVLVAVLVVFG